MAVDVKAIAAAKLAKLNSKDKNGGSSKFWKVPEGKSVIRLVPDKTGDFLREYHVHYNVGREHAFLCNKKMSGEKCVVCDFSFQLWQEQTEDTKKKAKDLMSSVRYVAPMICRGEEEKGVQFWSFSKKVYETLLGYILNPDYGDISDPETGFDLDIKYGKIAGASFPTTDILPKRKESPLLADKKAMKEVLDKELDYGALFNRLTPDQVSQALDRMLNGNNGNEEIVKGGKTDSTMNDVDKAFAAVQNDSDDVPY